MSTINLYTDALRGIMLLKEIKNQTNKNELIVFFSGFGAGFRYWKKVVDLIKEYDIVLLSEDYFNTKNEIKDQELLRIFKDRVIIGVGHSLGYAKLVQLNEKYDFFNLKKIVCVEGFSSFLSDIFFVNYIRKISLDAMICGYKINPYMTLFIFQIMCGDFSAKFAKDFNMELLIKDLESLNGSVKIPENIPHLILSSADDPIIPFYVIEDNFRKIKNAKIQYSFGSSHLLGMYNSKYIAEEIQKFI